MLRIDTRVVAGAALGLVALASITLMSVLPASGASTSSMRTESTSSSTPLSQTDINNVNSVGSLLAAKPGSNVSVIRAAGTTIWNTVSPGDSSDQTTPAVMAHDFLLVTCTDNPSQAGYKPIRGAAPAIGEVQVVIDEVTGHVLEITRIPKGIADPSATDVANLGTPTIVTLSAASFS